MLFLSIACSVVALDSAAKLAVHYSSWIRGFPRILPVQNPGYLLGVGQGAAPALTSVLFLVLMTVWSVRSLRARRVSELAAGLLIGGATSNVSERLVRGAVTDYLAIPWLVIDFGDVAVLIGLVVVVRAARRNRKALRPGVVAVRSRDATSSDAEAVRP